VVKSRLRLSWGFWVLRVRRGCEGPCPWRGDGDGEGEGFGRRQLGGSCRLPGRNGCRVFKIGGVGLLSRGFVLVFREWLVGVAVAVILICGVFAVGFVLVALTLLLFNIFK
jgi:hypothetical protein